MWRRPQYRKKRIPTQAATQKIRWSSGVYVVLNICSRTDRHRDPLTGLQTDSDDHQNKIAQSNLGTGRVTPQTPHCLQWGAPQSPPNYPLPWTDLQTQLPALSLDTSDLPSQTTSISDQSFCHNALDRQTDTHTHTDQQMVGGNVRWLYRS